MMVMVSTPLCHKTLALDSGSSLPQLQPAAVRELGDGERLFLELASIENLYLLAGNTPTLSADSAPYSNDGDHAAYGVRQRCL